MLRDDACKCNNVEIGSYDNQVEAKAPKWSSKETICLDRCLQDEIYYLWSQGIKTLGCCCGHKKTLPFINIEKDSIDRVIAMGYVAQTNPHIGSDGLKRRDTVYPQSIKINPNMIEDFINHYYNAGLLVDKNNKR